MRIHRAFGRKHSGALKVRDFDFEIKAVGDVLLDQLLFMRRCGFDSFQPDHPIDPAAAERALNAYPNVYQQAADSEVPVWKLRHG